jgi:hypothetical protein
MSYNMKLNKIVQEEKEKVTRNMINRYAYLKIDLLSLDDVPEEIKSIDIAKLNADMVTESNNEDKLKILRDTKEKYLAFKDLKQRIESMESAQLSDSKLIKLLDEAGKEVERYV